MTPADIAILAIVAPIGVGIIGALYRVGNLMGRIDERLKDIERRLDDVERSDWPVRRRRPSEH